MSISTLLLRSIPRSIVIVIILFASLPLIASFEVTQALLDKIEAEFDSSARKRVSSWGELMASSKNKSLPDKDKLVLVNDFFNSSILFVDDIDLWKQEDYWATPVEFLSMGAGDCEDFSIAKYFTLKELGIPEENLRITYVKAVELNQAHMVLTYFETKRSTPLVLDNLIPEIKPANLRGDLVPVYSFNGAGLWIAKSRGGGERVGDSSKISRWTDLENRMQ